MPQFLIQIMLENAQKFIQLATKPIRIAQASDNLESVKDRIPMTRSRMPNIKKEYQNTASYTSVGDFKLASQTHQSSQPSVLIYQHAHKNFRPKFLLVQKSRATRRVTSIHSISSLTMGGRINKITSSVALMINIQKMNRLLGINVLLWPRILDLLLQRIELIIFIISCLNIKYRSPSSGTAKQVPQNQYFQNRNYNYMEKIKKQRGSYSSAKKKKLAYSHQLQQQLSLKSAKKKNIKVVWTNKQGQECKQIISPNRCFCKHSFQCHQTPRSIGSAFCLSPGCKCKCFEYVPYYDIKCMCRHSYKEHDINSRMCKMCNKCLGFLTNWSCKCGMKYELHHTVFSVLEVTVNQDTSKSQRYESSSKPFAQEEKTNKIVNSSLMISKTNDARSYQFSKYDFQPKQYLNNEMKLEDHKKKQIQRINEKYSNINYERQMQSYDQSLMMEGNKICKPGLARTITPLELFIRPHRYVPLKLEQFLEKQYRKREMKSHHSKD